MLENMTELSVEYFRDICNATHNKYLDYPTVHSYVYDLNQCIMYLYHFHNYDNVIEINLNEELAKGEHVYYLPSLFEPEDNNAPIKPETPMGPTSGKIREKQTFKVTKTTDPDGDRVYYCFDWGDGSYSRWLHQNPYFIQTSATHTWKKRGDYEVRVKAKDIYGKESEWSDPLIVTMPKNKPNSLFYLFLEQHPHLFPVLRLLFDL
jgi:hypothetical protein